MVQNNGERSKRRVRVTFTHDISATDEPTIVASIAEEFSPGVRFLMRPTGWWASLVTRARHEGYLGAHGIDHGWLVRRVLEELES